MKKYIDRFFAWFASKLPKPLPHEEEHFTGLLDDPRSEEEKQRDYLHEERLISTASAADPFNNVQITESPVPDEDQLGVGSCVPHGVGGGLAIERKNDTGVFVRLAWSFIYRLRSTWPVPGCYLQEIFQKYKDRGACLFTTLPDPATEDQATNIVITPQMSTEAEIYKGKDYYMVGLKYNDITTLANIAQQGHAVPIIFFSTYDEWAREYPVISNPKLTSDIAEVRHCVYILPKSGFTLKGKRYVTIHDSAHFGGRTIRHLSEDFIAARVYGAGYWDTVALLGTGPRPKYRFTKTMKYGDSNEDVRHMQLLLINLGLLPNDCATGYFAGRTLAGVHAFQNMFAADILAPLKLDAPTDTFGSMSISKANLLCL